jgi:exodeoxyribonuclease VIII
MKHLSYSSLKAFAKSPNHYLEYISKDYKDTPAMAFGRAFHALLLEPDTFNERFAIAPKCDKRTKAGKDEWQSFSEANKGKEAIDGGDYENLLKMVANVQSEERRSLKKINPEVPVSGIIQDIEFKAILDGVSVRHIVDIKTTQDASPKSFSRAIFDLMYHLQAAIYCELTGINDYYILAVENCAPYNVQEYKLSFDVLQTGRVQLFELIRKFKNWDGTPESYSIGTYEITIPTWYK